MLSKAKDLCFSTVVSLMVNAIQLKLDYHLQLEMCTACRILSHLRISVCYWDDWDDLPTTRPTASSRAVPRLHSRATQRAQGRHIHNGLPGSGSTDEKLCLIHVSDTSAVHDPRRDLEIA